jgi:hypothetical protein
MGSIDYWYLIEKSHREVRPEANVEQNHVFARALVGGPMNGDGCELVGSLRRLDQRFHIV